MLSFPEKVTSLMKQRFENATLYPLVETKGSTLSVDEEGTINNHNNLQYNRNDGSGIGCTLNRDKIAIREQFGDTVDIDAMAIVMTDPRAYRARLDTRGVGFNIGELFITEDEEFYTNNQNDPRIRVYQLENIKPRDTHIILGLKRYRRNNFAWTSNYDGSPNRVYNQKDDDWLTSQNPRLQNKS